MIQQWLRVKGIGLALAGLLLLAACDTNPSPTPIPPVPTATSLPATAAPAPTNTAAAPVPTDTVAPAPTDTAVAPPTPSAVVPNPPPATATTGGSSWEHVLSDTTNVRALVAAPGAPATLYAGGEKFYRSTDSGATWTTLPAGFLVSEIAVAPSNAQILYAGMAEGCASGAPGDLRQSTDGGATWTTRSAGPANIDVNPTDPTHLLGIRCDGVYRSTDSGATWTKLPGTGVTNFDGRTLARGVTDRTVIYAAYLSEGGSLTLQRTTDDGRTWQTLPAESVQGVTDLAVDPTDAKHVFALTSTGVFVSADGGQTWTHQDKGLEHAGTDISGNPLIVTNLAFDQSTAASTDASPPLYLGETGFERAARIRHWTGNQWEQVAELPVEAVRQLLIAADGGGPALLAATEQGIFRLPLAALTPSNGGITPPAPTGPAPAAGTWQPVTQQVKDVRVLRASSSQPGTVYAGGNGVYRSTDGGATWAAISTPFQANEIALAPSDPKVIYAGTGEACYGSINPALYRTADGGTTWTPIATGPFHFAVSATDPNDLIGLQCDMLMRSRDGKSWQPTAKGDVANSSGVFLARGVDDPATAYVVFASEGGTAHVRRTTDSGATWTTLPSPVADFSNPQDIQVDPTDAEHVYLVSGSGFFASANGGQTWVPHNAGLEATRPEPDGLYHLTHLALDTSNLSPVAGATATLYLSSDASGLDGKPGQIFRSNGPDAWVPIADTPTTNSLDPLTFVPDPVHPALVAASGDSIYRLLLR